MLIRQANQKTAIFVTIGIFSIKTKTNFCNRCHDLLMMYMNLSGIVLVIAALLAELQKWGHKLNAKCWCDQNIGTL